MKKNTKKKEKASTIKTIFMGTGSFATPILSALLDEGHNVTAERACESTQSRCCDSQTA